MNDALRFFPALDTTMRREITPCLPSMNQQPVGRELA